MTLHRQATKVRASDADLIDLTNRVKLAAVALVEANRRHDELYGQLETARDAADEAASFLVAVERELLEAVRGKRGDAA